VPRGFNRTATALSPTPKKGITTWNLARASSLEEALPSRLARRAREAFFVEHEGKMDYWPLEALQKSYNYLQSLKI
jgi:hypothetical protein